MTFRDDVTEHLFGRLTPNYGISELNDSPTVTPAKDKAETKRYGGSHQSELDILVNVGLSALTGYIQCLMAAKSGPHKHYK